MSPYAQAATRLAGRRGAVALLLGGALAAGVLVQSVSATPEAETAAPAGCPKDKSTKPINVSQVSLPDGQLQIDRQEILPNPVTSDTQSIQVRIHVAACSGRSIGGALVYAEPTPYQQFAPTEQPTREDGWATLTLPRLRYFPASPRQELLVVFARARKSGEDLLGGVSARRLISFPVSL